MGNGQQVAGHELFGLNDPAPYVGAPRTDAGSTTYAHEAAAVGPAFAPTPQYVYVQGPPPSALTQTASPVRTGMYVLISVLLAISLVNLYLAITVRDQSKEALTKQGDELILLAQRLDAGEERYSQLSGEFQVTSEKLGLTEQEVGRAQALAAEYQKRQQQAVKQLNAALAQKASTTDLDKLQTDANAKLGGLSNDLAGARKDLDSTKAEFADALTGTKGELKSAIARNHDELVALAHRTDRDYFEFHVSRKHQQKIGSLAVELTKTNVGKNQFTVNLYFDDKHMERKDKSICEPVYFYMEGAQSALELVVNQLGKDTIAGYVSTPKGFFVNAHNVLSSRPGA